MKLLQVLGFWLALGSGIFVDPAYPPNTVSGGTVIAEMRIAGGNPERVTIHSGEEPFVSAARNALAQWQFQLDENRNALIIVHFRQPNLYYLNSANEKISAVQSMGALPYPRKIIGPAYPAQGMGQGSAVLRVRISAEGRVDKVEILKSAGILTDVSIEAVRKWEFSPAVDDRGVPETSYAYAVLVYRLPVIEPKK